MCICNFSLLIHSGLTYSIDSCVSHVVGLQVLPRSSWSTAGLRHQQAPNVRERRAVVERAVRPCRPPHRGDAGGKQERPGHPQDCPHGGGQGLCRSAGLFCLCFWWLSIELHQLLYQKTVFFSAVSNSAQNSFLNVRACCFMYSYICTAFGSNFSYGDCMVQYMYFTILHRIVSHPFKSNWILPCRMVLYSFPFHHCTVWFGMVW